jgi:leucyl/phenylalanyl-tRNA--protein transferase
MRRGGAEVPVYRLNEELVFPHPRFADRSGLLAVGGDLRPARLLHAYASGIFPWPHEGLPLLWFSPDPRLLLWPPEVHVSHSMRKLLHQERYRITLDRDFRTVMARCGELRTEGTWISPPMLRAYGELHDLGYAHSVEAWQGEELAGGLYGLSLGSCFFGESMFAVRPNSSKAALITLARVLAALDFRWIDCQVPTEHLMSLGARPLARARFLKSLAAGLRQPTLRGNWAELPAVVEALDASRRVLSGRG